MNAEDDAEKLKLPNDTLPRIETCDGISACDKALKLGKFKRLQADFIEGMACKGGCIKAL